MLRVLSVVAVATALSASAQAQLQSPSVKTQTGTANGLTYQARSLIVGVNSTGTIPAGLGDPRYFPVRPLANSVVQLLITRPPEGNDPGGNFVCTGSLLKDRVSIVTAAHCVSNGAGTLNPTRTRVFFYDGVGPADIAYTSTPSETVEREVGRYIVNPNYTGEVIDQNDIAVLRLTRAAPAFATGYDLATASDIVLGEGYNVYGLGGRGPNGTTGATFGTTRMRQGLNDADFTFGDSAFGGFFTDRDGNGEGFFGFADYNQSIVSDFDNGLSANDASCLLGGFFGTAQFCGLGRGLDEVSTAGGDSGGPSFINGKLSLITSYGLTFGTGFGDITPGLNSTFGEFNGFVPVGIHEEFLAGAQAVPEPASWAMLIMGFGLTGATMRRRRNQSVAA
jgi:hypothetical protein